MNVQDYLNKKALLASEAKKYRTICGACSQPDFSCYCAEIQTFDSKISFVILIHPIEAKRRIATGKMSHLILKDSYFRAFQLKVVNTTN